MISRTVPLDGLGVDREDGVLEADAVWWTVASKDGVVDLGAGTHVEAELEPGDYEVRMTVIDRAGAEAQEELLLTVLEHEPTFDAYPAAGK